MAATATYTPDTRLHDFLYNPYKANSKYTLNRGYLLAEDDLYNFSKLISDSINNHTLGLIKYPGIVSRTETSASTVADDQVRSYGKFEILAHSTANTFLINNGVAYDGYGNRLFVRDRTVVTLTFPADLDTAGSPPAEYGFLCVRRKQAKKVISYLQDPVKSLPVLVNYVADTEFYIAAKATLAVINGEDYYYPVVDSDGVIPGLVIGRVFKNAVYEPDMTTYRSPILAVKDGVFQPLTGFNLG